MGGTRALTAFLLLAIVLFSPSAATANEVDIEISPATVAPGEAVTVLSSCGRGEVGSEAFESTEMVSLESDDSFVSGATPTVHSDASSGVYEVEVTCHDGRFGVDELVVTDSGAGTGDGAMAGGANGTLAGTGTLLLLAAGLGAVLIGWRRRRAA